MENLPDTLAGITVLAPSVEKSPMIPCSESEGYRMRPIRIVNLSSEMAISEPKASFRSCTL